MMTVATVEAPSTSIEALYRQDGDRLWRALLAYDGDPDVASDAVAEAYAQLLRRGGAVRDPQAWVWRAGFRIAAGELKRRSDAAAHSARPSWAASAAVLQRRKWPPRVGSVAHRSAAPAHQPGAGQPCLALAFWRRDRPHDR